MQCEGLPDLMGSLVGGDSKPARPVANIFDYAFAQVADHDPKLVGESQPHISF